MTQAWIVKAERTIVGGYDDEVGTMFEMVFTNYAAMRCYVASKLGDTVDVPDKLAA